MPKSPAETPPAYPDSVLNESLYEIVRYANLKPLQAWRIRRRPGLPREQPGCTTASDAVQIALPSRVPWRKSRPPDAEVPHGPGVELCRFAHICPVARQLDDLE